MKARLKNWTKEALLTGRVLRLGNYFKSPSIVILGYHAVQDSPELYKDVLGVTITHSTSAFKSQMEFIARECNPVSLEEILLFLQGLKRLPKRAVAVTFDDGYRDNYEIAYPILRHYGIPAAFYLTTSLIGTREAPWFCRLRHAFATAKKPSWLDPLRGRQWKFTDDLESRDAALMSAFEMGSSMSDEIRRATIRTIEENLDVAPLALNENLMMTWDHARELSRAGYIVGSHTITHPNVGQLGDEGSIRWELLESKRKMEQELGAPVTHFSYPHPALDPHWTPRTVQMTLEIGYRSAMTTTPGPVRAGAKPLLLNRLIVPCHENRFRWALENTFLGRAA